MRSNKGTRDELGWRRLTRITNEVLEEFRQNFSRCGNRDVSPLRPRHVLEDYATNLKYQTSTIHEALLKVCVHILSFCFCFAFSLQTPCSSVPCQNSAKCVPNYSKDEYQCNCVPGYTGRHCETGETYG